MTEPFLQEIRATLETIAFYWKRGKNETGKAMQPSVLEGLLQRYRKLTFGSAIFELSFYQAVGNEWNDGYVAETSRDLLSTLVPDLEGRRPWYEAMESILDKGRFQEQGWKSFYHLEPAEKEQVAAELLAKTPLSSPEAAFRLEKLAKHLASKPGRWLEQEEGYRHGARPLRLMTICYYLHTPWERIMECQEQRTAAEMHYGEIQERLGERKAPPVPTAEVK